MTDAKSSPKCRALMKASCRLLGAAGLPSDNGTLIEVIRSLPASPAEADAGPSEGLCARCLLRAEEAAQSTAQYRRFERIARYVLDVFPGFPKRRRRELKRQALEVLKGMLDA